MMKGLCTSGGALFAAAVTPSACCCVEALFPRRHGRGPGLLLSFL